MEYNFDVENTNSSQTVYLAGVLLNESYQILQDFNMQLMTNLTNYGSLILVDLFIEKKFERVH